MNAKIFVDTNVFVYARDTTDPVKQKKAQAWITELWQGRQGCLSFQVLQKFYVTVIRKLDPGMKLKEARQDVRELQAWNPIAVNQEIVDNAWNLEDRFRLSWWDSLIVSSALVLKAEILLTEDLQEGMQFEGMKVVNPFVTSYFDLK